MYLLIGYAISIMPNPYTVNFYTVLIVNRYHDMIYNYMSATLIVGNSLLVYFYLLCMSIFTLLVEGRLVLLQPGGVLKWQTKRAAESLQLLEKECLTLHSVKILQISHQV